MKNFEKISIDIEGFEFIRNLIYERAGLVIDHNKQYLVESRMSELIKSEGIVSFEQLITMTRLNPSGSLSEKIVDAMTTNETYFFRDVYPFDILRKYLIPEMLAKIPSTRPLTVWSAACSTGQEPYSIAMIIKDSYPELYPGGVRILASDISREALTRARSGLYSQLEVNRGLPASTLVRHFQKSHDKWVLNDDIRGMVDFFEINLKGFWPPLPLVDIIFLRNVMIYFDLHTKALVLEKVRKMMNPEGMLVLGGSETTLMIDDTFKRNECEKSPYYTLETQKPLTTILNGVRL